MLRAQRRLLRPGGRLLAVVIELAPGLDSRARRRAIAAGPPHVATSSTYRSLMRSAGLVATDQIDQTAEYRATAAAWLRERDRHADALRTEVGDDVYDERTTNGLASLDAIDHGLLRRTIYLGERAWPAQRRALADH